MVDTNGKRFFDYPGSPVLEVDFEACTEMLNAENDVVDIVLLIYSETCPHCLRFIPKYEQIAQSYKGFDKLRFLAINVAQPGNFVIVHAFAIPGFPAVLHAQRGIGVLPVPYFQLATILLSKYSGFVPKIVSTSNGVLSPDSNLLSDAENLQWDAGRVMRIILNTEVFKAEEEITHLLPLKALLLMCMQSFRIELIATDCALLYTSLPRVGLTRESWISLLGVTQTFKPFSIFSIFNTCSQYSCALWRLLHMFTIPDMENNSPIPTRNDKMGPLQVMEGIRMVVENFFSCSECRTHFLAHYDSKDFGRSEENLDWKQLALWLWRFHNGVSSRVQNKAVVWPSENEDFAYQYLVDMYTKPYQNLVDTKERPNSIAADKSMRETYFVSILFALMIMH